MKRDLKAWLSQLHIVADFEVVEMGDSEISAYTVERTVQMMDRANLLRELMQSAPEEPSVVPVCLALNHLVHYLLLHLIRDQTMRDQAVLY